jgi:hypothetical protein
MKYEKETEEGEENRKGREAEEDQGNKGKADAMLSDWQRAACACPGIYDAGMIMRGIGG